VPLSPLTLALRRCALAVSVLTDLDVRPHATGVSLPGAPAVRVGWPEIRRAVRGADPESPLARQRLGRWLWTRRWVADRSVDELRRRARPFAAYVEDPEHPGIDWVRKRLHGDTIDLGVGFVGADRTDPDRVVPVPQTIVESAGLSLACNAWWLDLLTYVERMGGLAAERLQRAPSTVLRPMGDCDVLSLLASRRLRAALVTDHQGMRAVAVPTRSRGWLELRAIDPAFALVAARLASDDERALPRPALITADEVTVVREGGRPVEIVLRDAAPEQRPVLRSVPFS
jgi:hypothetical protein